MDKKTFEKIINDLSALEYYGRLSPHYYGEPLLDKRLPALIKYARQRLPNCYISMSTNGDFLKGELCEELIRNGIDRFVVTNYDDEDKPALIALGSKFPFHIYLRSYKEIAIVDRAGEIMKRKRMLNTPCLRPSSQVVIDWKGDVLLCCQDYYGKFKMGNINKSRLIDIWNNDEFTRIRNDLSLGKRANIGICKFCDYHGGKP